MKYPIRALGLLMAAAAVLSAIPRSTLADTRPREARLNQPPGERQRFTVEPFRNVGDVDSLNYLCAGLPAIVAERLGHLHPLQFVGPATLIGSSPSPPGAWLLGGEFSTVRERITVTVSVRQAGSDGRGAEASRTGDKKEVPQLTVEAALEAFRKAGAGAPMAVEGSAKAFARDPYAFILYARGVGAHVGLHSRDNGRAAAKKWLVRALRIDPRCTEIMRYLGLVELAGGSADHARASWIAALDIRPDYVAALTDLARLDLDHKQPAARARYARLVALDPEDVDARRVYGQLLVDAGDYAQAKRELLHVLGESPDDLVARRALVPVLAADGSGAALVDNLEAVVRLDENDLDARLGLAAAYANAGRPLEAEAAYEEVLRRKPHQMAVLKSAGDLAFAQGDYAKAMTHFQRMRALAPSDPRPVFRLGTASFAAGDLKAAERWFSEAAQFPGMAGPAYANLAAVSLRRGQTKEALWLLGRAAKRRPRQLSVHFNLALALLADNRAEEARVEAQTAQEIAPDDAGVQYLAGVVALRLAQPGQAERAFRETLRLDPKHADAAYNLDLLRSSLAPEPEALLR